MPLPPPSLSARCPARPWVLGLLLGLMLTGTLPAQASREYDIKAVFLYNFVAFVEWPAAARPGPGAPIIIGILGRDPFGAVLDEVVAGEKLKGHPLEVRRYRTPEAALEAHILYISTSETWRLGEILRVLRSRPVLTVADVPQTALASEAIITFSTGNRVELRVNPAAAQQAGLSISSKLLRVATVSGPGATP